MVALFFLLAIVATIVVSVESLVPQGVTAILGSFLLLAALAVDRQVVTGDQRWCFGFLRRFSALSKTPLSRR